MVSEPYGQKLVAILYADVVGYSRLTGEDEAGTHRTLRSYLDLFTETVKRHAGQVMHYAGDAILADFGTVSQALTCAITVQQELEVRNKDLPEGRQVRFRIGVNLGEVIADRGDIYGDGVNVAARLEGLAEPGGVCVSEAVRGATGTKLPLDYAFIGERQVKNIREPVRAYRVELKPGAELPEPRTATKPRTALWRVVAIATTVFVVIGGGILAWLQPWEPREKSASVERMVFPLPNKPSIVVLPFDNLSADPELEYFSDGITEDIITQLARWPEFAIIARNSSFTYKGKSVKVKEVARDLGVQYVVEGSVRKSGDQVRITAQLIDGSTGHHIWAGRFDETSSDVLALQDRVTQRIVTTLGGDYGQIRKKEYEFAWLKPSASLDEYDYFLRGHSIFYRETKEANAEARRIWQEGLEKFPRSGLLRVKLGWTYFQDAYAGWTDQPGEAYARAFQFVDKGLSDDHLPPAGQRYGLWLRSFVYLWHKHDHERALRDAKAAVELFPYDAETLVMSSKIAAFSGEPAVALKWVDGALSAEPHPPGWYVRNRALAQFVMEQYHDAIDTLGTISSLDADGLRILAAANAAIKHNEAAHSAVLQLRELIPELNLRNVSVYLPYKNRADLERELAYLREAGLPE